MVHISAYRSQPCQCQHLPLMAGGPSNEVSNEPLMCSHTNAKEKERALGQFTLRSPAGWASVVSGAGLREWELKAGPE